MTKQSPHKRWKGCQLCKPHKNRNLSDSQRFLRDGGHRVAKQVGARRRWNRHDVPQDE